MEKGKLILPDTALEVPEVKLILPDEPKIEVPEVKLILPDEKIQTPQPPIIIVG